MSDEKWTPGPWWIEGLDAQTGDVVAKDGDWEICTFSRYDGNREHDAHLIAAAPELYAALEGIIEYTRACEALLNVSESGHCIDAKAALAKARGEYE